MNIKELVESWEGKSKEQIIESLINELKEINKEEKINKRWKPEYRESYFCIDANGDVGIFTYEDDDVDKFRYLTGNMFKTKEEADEQIRKINCQIMFKKYIEEHNEKIDWNNLNQCKYYIYYNYGNEKIEINWHFPFKIQGVIYASNDEILKNVVKLIGEENVKKYILEVE